MDSKHHFSDETCSSLKTHPQSSLTQTHDDSKSYHMKPISSSSNHDDHSSCVSTANDAKNVSPCSTSDNSIGVQQSKKGLLHSVMFHTPSSKDADATSKSPKDNLFDSSSEQVGSHSKETAVDDVSSHKSIADDDPKKVVSKLEARVISDCEEPMGTLKSSGQAEADKKSNELDIREPSLHSPSGDETDDDSDIVEHDVKVCDICGDAGREDMLAICSRCSDGAEHTYCMRKMLRKIPGSDWMCEECKFAEEINSQKQEMEGKKLSKLSGSSAQFSSKRVAENIEVAPAAKRQALETSLISPKSSSPKRVASLSRDSSFKNLDKERSRPAQQVSVGNQSINNPLETARSATASPRLQTLRGTLLKSNSFNASNYKPKSKLVDDVVPPKQKGVKDHTFSELKERPIIGKSMSFKSANMGRSSTFDSKVKMLSPRISHAVDQKGLKSMKERNTFERKSLSKLDRPSITSSSSSTVSTPKADVASRAESNLLSFPANSRDSKVQTEGKSSTSKPTGNPARKTLEGPVTSGGAPSTTDQKLNHVTPKDETFPLTAEKTSNGANGTMPDGLSRSQETTEKLKESSSRLRTTVMSSSTSTFCQKCKQLGHYAEFCRSSSLEASDIDSSSVTARSSREDSHKGSKLKEAIQAALLKKPDIQRRKRTVDQVDEISTLNTNLNPDIASHDQSSVANKSKHVLNVDGAHERQPSIPKISTSDSINIAANATTQHAVPSLEDNPSVVKRTAKDFINNGLPTLPQLAKMSAIPEYEYTWRGSFEVNKSGSFLELCGGIQAHLSSCVSPRVPEVVKKFPQKLSLNEVPRLSAWPMQFYDGGAKEYNIALYFFAKDLESYERNYKSLLDRMIKHDLALKGNFEGVELLIFPSNQLPENSQRWNMLYFLWGVFRARKLHCSDSSNNPNVPNFRIMQVDKKAANVVTMSENVCSPKFIEPESSGCDHSFPKSNGDCRDQGNAEGLKAGTTPRDSRTKYTSNVDLPEKMGSASSSLPEKSPSDQALGAELKPSPAVAGANSSDTSEKAQSNSNHSDSNKEFSSPKVLPSKEDAAIVTCEKKVLDIGVGPAVIAGYGTALVGTNTVKHERELNGGGEIAKRESSIFGRVRSCERDEYCRQPIERKRPYIDLTDRAPPATSDISGQNIDWSVVNNIMVDGDNVGKKQKTSESDVYGSANYGWRGHIGSDESKQKDLVCMSVEEKDCIDKYECAEKVIPEDLGTSTTERRFFPVDLSQGNSAVPWKRSSGGRGEDRIHDGFPNLELALGAETRAEMKPQNKGILPFLVGLGEKQNNHEKAVEDKEDDVSASLSLSLSFPIQDKEETGKAVSKPEQVRGERHNHVNTSLLLFPRE